MWTRVSRKKKNEYKYTKAKDRKQIEQKNIVNESP